MIESAIEILTLDGAADGFPIQLRKEGHSPSVIYLTYFVGIDDTSRIIAIRLAGEVYAVLLPNIFYRNDKPPIFNFPFRIGDERSVRRMNEIRGPLTNDAMDRNLSGYVDFLAKQPSVRGKALALSASVSSRKWRFRPLRAQIAAAAEQRRHRRWYNSVEAAAAANGLSDPHSLHSRHSTAVRRSPAPVSSAPSDSHFVVLQQRLKPTDLF